MSPNHRDSLLKKIRSKDFRVAYKAIAQLRHSDDESLAHIIAAYKPRDEQRAFQYHVALIVLREGIAGLITEWHTLSSSEWRERLVDEIGQFPELWTAESTIDLLIHAIDDPVIGVNTRAILGLHHCIVDIDVKEQRATAKTISGKATLDAKRTLKGWITRGRRNAITQAVLRLMRQPYKNKPDIGLLQWSVELLGHTANREDLAVIDQLSELRTIAGEPYTTSYEDFDPDNLPWPEQTLADTKRITPTVGIRYIPTGLLDIDILETALESIRNRAP
jgi:hypothetical protein